MQHVVLIFKWIFLFYSLPTSPSPFLAPVHTLFLFHLCFLFVLFQNALEVLTTSNCRATMPLPRPPHTHGCSSVYGVHPSPPLPLLHHCIITVIIIIFTIVCSISVLPCASGQPVNAFIHSHSHSHSHSYSHKPIGKSLRNPSTRVSLSTREGRCITYSFLDCWLALFFRVIAWFGDLLVDQWMTCCLVFIQMNSFYSPDIPVNSMCSQVPFKYKTQFKVVLTYFFLLFVIIFICFTLFTINMFKHYQH